MIDGYTDIWVDGFHYGKLGMFGSDIIRPAVVFDSRHAGEVIADAVIDAMQAQINHVNDVCEVDGHRYQWECMEFDSEHERQQAQGFLYPNGLPSS